MSTPETLLELHEVTTQFDTSDGVVRAVNAVSFDVGRGRVLGVVGESGSGKSVTARSVMRMVREPGRTVAGQVLFEGRDLLGLNNDQMRQLRGQKIALVFQDPQSALNPVMRVGDQIVEAMRVHGVSKAEAKSRARELLVQVGIPDVDRRLTQFPHQFSGGMRQRVVIAIALANRPSLLIADEPTTALDVTIQAQILKLVVELKDQFGISVMIITHDMGVVAELCTDVAVMYAGRVVERGEVDDVMRAPRHPYTAALMSSMPRMETPRNNSSLPVIPGSPPDPTDLPAGCAFHPRCAVARPECSLAVPTMEQQPGTNHLSACFVAAQGLPVVAGVTEPQASTAGRPFLDDERREPILEVIGLRTDVGSRRQGLLGRRSPAVMAVDGVSLELRPGITLGLVGESGCGKSTLSRTVVGLNKVAGGRIVVKGVDVSAQTEDNLATVRSSLQYVFQDPSASLNPRRTVGQSLGEALALRGLHRSEVDVEAASLLERVGLHARYLDRYPHSFSGGQRQRIGIARALASQPEALILDEPVSALDVSIQAQIINLLEELQQDLNLAYLFISHDLSVVKHLSREIAVMYLGRIVESGPAELVYARPQHPYTAALLSSTPSPDLDHRNRERIVLVGDLPSLDNPPQGCRFRTRCPIGSEVDSSRTICREIDPVLTMAPTGQGVACHFPGELAGHGVLA